MSIESQSDTHQDSWTNASKYSSESLRPSSERTCEVQPDAREQLERWGISEEHVDQLVRLSSRYEYADCLGKANQLAQRGGIFTRAADGTDAILLPDFFDIDQREGGQCVEIAAKVLRDMHATGWL